MTSVIHSWLERIALKKQVIHSRKNILLYVLDSFSPFLWAKVNRSLRSSLSPSFLKSHGSDTLLSLFKKEGSWSLCSLQKRNWEPFAPAAHDKRATAWSNLLLITSESLFCSQKTSDSLKQQMSKFPTLQTLHLMGGNFETNSSFYFNWFFQKKTTLFLLQMRELPPVPLDAARIKIIQ